MDPYTQTSKLLTIFSTLQIINFFVWSQRGLPQGSPANKLKSMAITLEEIVEEAAQLPPDVSAELVERILVARHGGIESSVEAAWRTEVRNRMAEIAEGRVEGIPLEESLARAASVLRQ